MKLTEFVKKYDDVEIDEKELCAKLGIKQKIEKWVPKIGEKYWYTTVSGLINTATWGNDSYDKFKLRKRNVYQTEDQCQFAMGMHDFCKERSFEPDWSDDEQYKVCIVLDFDDKSCEVITNYRSVFFCPFYYPTQEKAQEVIDKYSFEELAEYYGRV